MSECHFPAVINLVTQASANKRLIDLIDLQSLLPVYAPETIRKNACNDAIYPDPWLQMPTIKYILYVE